MIEMLMKALTARDEELEFAADQKQGELDVIRTERTSIAGQLRLLEKLDLNLLAPYLAPPVLILPEMSADTREQIAKAMSSPKHGGHLMLASEPTPVSFQRINPKDGSPMPPPAPEEEDRVEAEEPFVAEPPPALSEERVREIAEEAHAAVSRSTGAQGVRPALIAYLDKAITASGSLLVDEKMISKKVGFPFIGIKKALLILEAEGKLALKNAPKGMLAVQVDRKALASEIL